MDAPAISIRGLTKRFGAGVALDGVDLDVPRGTILGLLGATGAGKSTLVRIVAGLAKATAGSVAIGGEAVRWGGGAAARRRLGVVLHGAEMPPWMTGRDVLAFSADLAGVPRADIAGRVEKAAATLAVGDSLGRPVVELPGALRARLAIAQALIGEPDVVLLDEPFHGIDPERRADVRGLLAGMRGARTIVLATDRPADVTGLCDRVVVMAGGRIVADGTVAAVLEPAAGATYVIETDQAGGLAIDGLVARLRAESWVDSVATAGGALRVRVRDHERASRELLPSVVGTGLGVRVFRREAATIDDVVAAVPRR